MVCLNSGGGPLVINSTNSYTGPTDVGLGTLLLADAGSIAASPTLNVAAGATLNVQGTLGLPSPVPAGQTLTGNGTVVGPILIAGKLAPAFAASGHPLPQAMLFSNRLVLAGETSLTISQNAALNQTIKVAGDVQFGGVLTVSTNRNEIFTTGGQFEGETFLLFNASNYVGSFCAVNLPPECQWDTSQLITQWHHSPGWGPPRPFFNPASHSQQRNRLYSLPDCRGKALRPGINRVPPTTRALGAIRH